MQTSVTFIGNATNATVVTADIRVCNSVVHIVNHVLLPSSNLTAIPVFDNKAPTPGMSRDCYPSKLRDYRVLLYFSSFVDPLT